MDLLSTHQQPLVSESFVSFETNVTELPSCNKLRFLEDLNNLMQNPNYKVVFFTRHAHAVQENKKHPVLDRTRPLDEKGERDAEKLGETLSVLSFKDVIFLTSSATRTFMTAEHIIRMINAESFEVISSEKFYHVPVKNYFEYLRYKSLHDRNHVFFVGHNSAMTKVLLKISGRPKAFIPTAGVMALAIKTDNWRSFYQESHDEVHVFTWSPRETHVLESASVDEETEFSHLKVGEVRLDFAD